MSEVENPYLSPKTSGERAIVAPITFRVRFAFVVIGCLAYHFMISLWLFTGSGHDGAIAIQCLANSPVFAFWIISLWRRREYSYLFGVLAGIVQSIIYLINGGRLQFDDWMMLNASVIVLILVAITMVEPKYLRNLIAGKSK